MCDLCAEDKEVVKSEIRRLYRNAILLNRIALHLHKMADGIVEPHSPADVAMRSTVEECVKYLASEYGVEL